VSGPVGEALIMTAPAWPSPSRPCWATTSSAACIGRIEADLEGFARDLRELLAHHARPG
jgi:biopolymer transport protein ExbB